MKRLFVAALASFSLIGLASPLQAQQMIECFETLCADFNSFEFVVSKISGAPKYEVSRFKGTRSFSNGKFETIMEIDCQREEFRTIKIRDGKTWSNFDPRWSEQSDRALLDMACADRD